MADPQAYSPAEVVAPGDGWVAPKGRTPDGRLLADGSRRLLGLLVDLAIWGVPQMLVLTAAVVAFYLGFPEGSDGPEGPALVAAVLLYLLVFAIGILRLAVEAEKLARSGQTWGMRAMQLRLVDGKTGGPVTRGRAWGRAAFAALVSGQLMGFGYWWSFFDDRNRTLHDLVCSTVVIDER